MFAINLLVIDELRRICFLKAPCSETVVGAVVSHEFASHIPDEQVCCRIGAVVDSFFLNLNDKNASPILSFPARTLQCQLHVSYGPLVLC